MVAREDILFAEVVNRLCLAAKIYCATTQLYAVLILLICKGSQTFSTQTFDAFVFRSFKVAFDDL